MRPLLAAAALVVAILLPAQVQAATGAPPTAAAAGFQSDFSGAAKRAFDLGLRAYVYGLPLLNEKRVIDIFPPNTLISVTQLSNPAQRLVVLPNVDTVYTVARLKLDDGPLVLHVPPEPGRYYTMQLLDAYTNSFGYVGSRTTGTGAGDYAIAGPGWKGALPSGVRLVRSPTPTVWLLGRTLVNGEGDLPAVNAIQHEYKLTPLAQYGGEPRPSIFLPSSNLTPPALPTGLEFFDAMGAAMKDDPPPKRDRRLLRRLARVGIAPGVQTSRAKLSAARRAGLEAAVSAGPRLLASYGLRTSRASAKRHNGWLLPAPAIGNFGTDYLLRAYVSDIALGANVRREAVYPVAETDSRGRRLSGAHRYRLHFAPGKLPPVRAFWSLTLYGPDRFLVDNPIDRYAVGNRTAGLARNADGSLDVYIRHDPPPGRESNWLPAPAGRFSLVLRLYVPKRSVLQDRWPLPRVKRTG
jgi:hypothetical protein